MGLGTLTLLGILWAPGQAAPADVYHFNLNKMDIPIRYDPAKKNEIRDLLLYVSRNQGESWEQYAVASPDRDTVFPFSATVDGSYWFQMMIVDKQGRRDPVDLKKAPVGLKVLIDTKSPVIVIRSLDRSGDEATVAWDIQEANPDWSKFLVEYRAGDNTWLPVSEARGGPVGSARFRASQAGPLSVRIQAYDLAGNRSEMTKDAAAPVNVASTMKVVQPDITPASGTGTANDSTTIPVLPPLDPQVNIGRPGPVTGNVIPPPAPIENRVDTSSPLAVSPQGMQTPSGVQLPPAQVINVARFDVAYDVEQKGPSGISRAEVWVTRDDGRTWQKWSTTEKTESPLTVDLATKNNQQVEGIYGIKIVLLSGAGLSKGPPSSGEAPDMRVDVDTTPPIVKIWEPVPDPNQKDTMIIRWQAVDRNIANDPITLEWAEQTDGPWQPIVSGDANGPIGSNAGMAAKRLPNTGQYSWKLPMSFPTHRVYVRVTARDTAGNVGEVRSPHPILVDMNKPVAKIHGIIGAAAPDKR